MKRSFFGLFITFILLTTYSPKKEVISKSSFTIKNIEIFNNSILSKEEIDNKINFLYGKNLFLLNLNDLEKNLKELTFIESYTLKKVYPNSLKIFVKEIEPVAILQNKKQKFYISSKGKFINFLFLEKYKNLPTVFGSGSSFYSLYQNLIDINFPIEEIKSFYSFEMGRWDLKMTEDRIIKLPANNYLSSLKNFLDFKNSNNFDDYKIFDYRIKDQLILN